jgi:hypothetical protein
MWWSRSRVHVEVVHKNMWEGHVTLLFAVCGEAESVRRVLTLFVAHFNVARMSYRGQNQMVRSVCLMWEDWDNAENAQSIVTNFQMMQQYTNILWFERMLYFVFEKNKVKSSNWCFIIIITYNFDLRCCWTRWWSTAHHAIVGRLR